MKQLEAEIKFDVEKEVVKKRENILNYKMQKLYEQIRFAKYRDKKNEKEKKRTAGM